MLLLTFDSQTVDHGMIKGPPFTFLSFLLPSFKNSRLKKEMMIQVKRFLSNNLLIVLYFACVCVSTYVKTKTSTQVTLLVFHIRKEIVSLRNLSTSWTSFPVTNWQNIVNL